MKKMRKISLPILVLFFFLSATLLPSMRVNATQSASGNFNSATLTGNPATDMVAVATAQANRSKSSLGYTEAWCADFVSDCAKITGQSAAIPFNGGVGNLYRAVLNAGGQVVSSPQAGDLLFYYCNTESAYAHVGIMKSSTLSIQGNVNGIVFDNLKPGNYKDSKGHKIGSGLSAIYVRPNYRQAADTTPPSITNVSINEVTDEYFKVTYTVSDNVGLNNKEMIVHGPTRDYSFSYNSDGGNRIFTFSWKDEPDGDYYVTISAWDKAGNKASVDSPIATKKTDFSAPTISNVVVSDVSPTGYTVSCTVTDNVGVTKVEFPTWTEANGQDDLVWHQGTINGNTASCRINISDHNGEQDVYYITHIYAYDFSGNHSSAGTAEYPNLFTYISKPITYAQYTVLHYKENMNGAYELFEEETFQGIVGQEVTPETKSYTGFTTPTTRSNTVNSDGSTTINYYYTRNSYTLKWSLDGGSASGTYTKGSVKYEAPITQPVPTKKGYTFAGWNKKVPTKMPAKNQTFKALWEAKYATVTFEVNGGKALSEKTRKVQEYTAFGELPATSRTGYTFSGWYTAKSGGTKVTAETVCEGNMTLYAHWKAKTNTKYTVEHYRQKVDGTYALTATESESFTGKTNATVTPEVKTYKGFTSPEATSTKIKADGSLVVKYYYTRNSYKLTWDFDGGSAKGSYSSGNVIYGSKITAPTPVKEGYEFTGWDKTVSAKMPAKNVSYKAIWRKLTQEEQVEAFVQRFYVIILDRPAEPKGLNDWTLSLLDKKKTGADVAVGFINSPEFQGKNMTDEEYLTKLYLAFFDREPDKAGFESWKKELKNGKSRDYVLGGFINSVEFNNLCKKYGIRTGSY